MKFAARLLGSELGYELGSPWGDHLFIVQLRIHLGGFICAFTEIGVNVGVSSSGFGCGLICFFAAPTSPSNVLVRAGPPSIPPFQLLIKYKLR